MKQIKLISLILVVIVMLSAFAGCGGKNDDSSSDKKDTAQSEDKASSTISDDNNNENSSDTDTDSEADSPKEYITTREAFLDKASELFELSLYGELNESGDKELGFSTHIYSMDYLNQKEYALDYKIKLGDGSEIVLPITYSELEKKGWTFRTNSSAERELEPDYLTQATLINANGQTLDVSIYNNTSNNIALKDGIVIDISSQQYNSDATEKLNTAIDFSVCGSLSQKSTLEDIVDTLGNPYMISYGIFYNNDGEYYYSSIEIQYKQKSSAYSHITFELSGSGNYITSVSYGKNPYR